MNKALVTPASLSLLTAKHVSKSQWSVARASLLTRYTQSYRRSKTKTSGYKVRSLSSKKSSSTRRLRTGALGQGSKACLERVVISSGTMPKRAGLTS